MSTIYRSKRTWVSVILLLVMLFTTVLFLGFGVNDITQGLRLSALFPLSMGILGAVITTVGITNRVIVDLSGVAQKNVFRKRKVHWKDVKSIFLDGNGYGGYNTVLEVKTEKNMIIFSALSGKSNELTKAIVEAATYANASIELKGVFAKVIGPPPYGIFGAKVSRNRTKPREKP